MTLQDRIDALRAKSAQTPGVTSLVVFGSTTKAAAPRRDRWSDIDFNLFISPDDAGKLAKENWPFLPDAQQLVLTAREGENGGVALYDDGMICEFGAGFPWEIQDPDYEILLDGGDLTFVPPPHPPDVADELGLFLVKLLIGYGRIQRGEVVSGNGHLRGYAVTALAEVLRQTLVPEAPRSPFDPLRRLEQALPELAAEIAVLQLADAPTCALGLLNLAERELADTLPGFPQRAFQVARQALSSTD